MLNHEEQQSEAQDHATQIENAEMNKEVTERYADYLKGEGWCFDFSTAQPRAFNMKTSHHAAVAHLTFMFGEWARHNKVRVGGNYKALIEDLNGRLQALLTRIVGHAFRPDGSKLIEVGGGVTLANTHVPFKPVRTGAVEMPPIFEEYLGRVFMNEQDRKVVLDWCADIIQNPMRRPEWGVIMSGDQGTGKSSMVALVHAALGGRHVWQRSEYKPVLNEFSEVLPNHLLICFDDAVAKSDTYEKLKYIVSTKRHQVSIKFVQAAQVRDVFARIMICTNKEQPFAFEGEDRRFYVCERSKHKAGRQESHEFFERFYQWFGERGTATLLYYYFAQRDLTQFKPGSTIQTRELALMGGASRSDIRARLVSLIATGPCLHTDQILDHLGNAGYRLADTRRLSELMASLGYVKVRRKVPGCHTYQVNVWQPSGGRGRSLSASEIETIQRYATNRSMHQTSA